MRETRKHQSRKYELWESLPCVKTEELILLTDEWQMYAEMNIPQDWLQQKDGKTARVDHYWNKVLQSKPAAGSPQF